VELELHFTEPVGYVFAVDAFDEDAPLVGVVGGSVGRFVVGVEGVRFAAEDFGG
jgi:hypothetical protein